MFSICHIASLIGRNVNSTHSTPDQQAVDISGLHTAAGQCLVLGKYHRPQKFTVEALSLYGYCKILQSLNPCREAGAILAMVVRMCYEQGYHRDPDNSRGTFTVFEGEMHRRFWAAVKQLDLMISFQLGLPERNICLEDSDTRSSSNLLDSDFDTETSILPPSRP